VKELISIGLDAAQLQEEDTQQVIRCLQSGEDIPVPRSERVTKILEEGIGGDGGDDGVRRSLEGRAVVFANRVSRLSLTLTKLKAFKDRQGDVFQLLMMAVSR